MLESSIKKKNILFAMVFFNYVYIFVKIISSEVTVLYSLNVFQCKFKVPVLLLLFIWSLCIFLKSKKPTHTLQNHFHQLRPKCKGNI